jgi:2-polyprenyl-6-methoxyphenol hydroxylase-like FAD-dependent oxidoreductase
VLEAILGVAPPITRGTFAFDEGRVESGDVADVLGAPMVNVRRVTLDAILLDAAAAAGADVRTETTVTGLVRAEGRVAGVDTNAGQLRAPILVGADGVRSTVAQLVGAREYERTPACRTFMWAYFDGAAVDRSHMFLGKIEDVAYLASPTDAGLFMVAVAPSADRRGELRGDRAAGYAQALAGWPELESSLAGATRAGPILMMTPSHGYFRESAGAGWVLTGDAGHFKDPTPGQGISDALRQAVELAQAIERSLDAALPNDEPLRDWWSWRDRDAWEMYWFARDMGAPGATPPLRKEIQRRMAAEPELLNGLLRVLSHEMPPSKIFTPSLALAATTRALLRGRGERKRILREAYNLVAEQLRHRKPPSHAPTRRDF